MVPSDSPHFVGAESSCGCVDPAEAREPKNQAAEIWFDNQLEVSR